MKRGYITTDNKCVAPIEFEPGCSGKWIDYEMVNWVEGGDNYIHAITRRKDRLRVHHAQGDISRLGLSILLKATLEDKTLTPDQKAEQWYNYLHPHDDEGELP